MQQQKSTELEREVERDLRDPVSRSRLEKLLAMLGSFYGIALATGLAASVLFAWLADEVLEATFAEFNRGVLLAIHAHATPVLDGLALSVSWLGSGIGLLVLTTLFVAWLLRRREIVDVWILLVAVVGGWILSASLKLAFQQERPRLFPHLEPAIHYSFPSGHALVSFVFWGFLAVWLLVQKPRDPIRWGIGLLCMTIASAVAFSRLYIGVHWPTDAAAGMLIATIWLSWLFAGRQWLVHRLERRRGERGKG